MKLQDLLVEDDQQQVVNLHDILMEENKVNQKKKKRVLQKEVMKLTGELEEELAMNKALRALHRGSVLSQPRLSLLLLPPQVQELVEELAKVEAEILWLEKKIEELKLEVYKERKHNEEQEIRFSSSKKQEKMINEKILRKEHHRPSTSSETSIKEDVKNGMKSRSRETFADEINELSRMHISRTRTRRLQVPGEGEDDEANLISEQLVSCLIAILLELNQASREREGTSTVSKLSLSLLKNASFKRKSALSPYDHRVSNLDPYGVVADGSVRDIGPYKNFIHITRNSIDVSRLVECSTAVVNLRGLIERLNKIEFNGLSHKQKLAFWINIYNACILNGYLEYGLPSSQEKFKSLLKKASLKVGGMVLNAPAIESYILLRTREKDESVTRNEKHAQAHKFYRLGFPEPNLTFTLCSGNWSSPALRVYSAEEVVDDLIRARMEYLEASIGLSSKKKIVMPYLLHKHLREFGDDVESLLEWICTQLPPRCSSLKEIIYEYLRNKQVPIMTMIEIQPQEHEFRYLLPSYDQSE